MPTGPLVAQTPLLGPKTPLWAFSAPPRHTHPKISPWLHVPLPATPCFLPDFLPFGLLAQSKSSN